MAVSVSALRALDAVPMIRHDRAAAPLAVLSDAPLLVHSHLRWDFVWQRPQQLLSRFAQHAPVLFVEEAIFVDDLAAPALDITQPTRGVTRVVPKVPSTLYHDADGTLAAVRGALQQALATGGPQGRGVLGNGQFAAPVQWFYTPMPAPAMLGAFGERAVVYDCMDELAQFKFAPPELIARERLLISKADVVFTGGYKLWQSKSKLHPNVHFFGCGVDSAHFAKARLDSTPRPADLPEQDAPILGFYGVIDERIDYALIAHLAAAFPESTIAMAGPVVKVDPKDLPKAPNIRWLGQKQYAELPMYAKAFDVCLMPFALNEATEYINPTKTLEYMAAGKPIVSTAVADVVRNFTPVVKVARSYDGFAAAVRASLNTPDAALIARGIGMAADASWESIVGKMRRLIAEAVAHNTPALEPTGSGRLAVAGGRGGRTVGEELTA
ncbi:glycosyl transferase [Gemmatimonadetes bacterium T265]|nr:glycosyl transferase [Gemmatimonadetes bacterium T265]